MSPPELPGAVTGSEELLRGGSCGEVFVMFGRRASSCPPPPLDMGTHAEYDAVDAEQVQR